MKKLLLLLVLFYAQFLVAQTYETGKIIDSVSVSETQNETYTLYLPSSYNATKLSSIVYIFDPMGRGKIGIAPFLEASETYGHILVCSNNTKNGPYNQNFDITGRLFSHIFSFFNINEKQIYLAGFSGGSRLASAIATLTNQIEGVVACGAGFSQLPMHVPSNQNYSYVGVCGNRDMNYTEMISVRGYLEQKKFTNTLITYDGNHRWPPPKQLLKAFDWLAIQTHIKGGVVLDEGKIKKSYLKNYKEAKRMENEGDLLGAVENYERILATYSSFYTLDSVVQGQTKIRKNKEYKNSIKALTAAFQKETELSNKFYSQFNKDYLMPTKANYGWWRKELGKLEKVKSSSNVEMNKMVERIKTKIYIMAYSKNNPESTKKQKEFNSALFKLIYPDYRGN